MAEWSRDKVEPQDINDGEEFTPDSDLTIKELNAMVNNSFYGVDFVEGMTEQPIVDNSNPDEPASVLFVPYVKDGKTYYKFKFLNIKGEQGIQGIQGEKGDKGDGISLLKGAMCRKLASDFSIQNYYSSNIPYDTQLVSVGSGLTYSNGNFTVGSGITAIKFTFSSNFYNMTTVGYMILKIYKNNVDVNQELWFFYNSGISGGFSQSIMLPCTNGDTFNFKVKADTGSGYLNNNSFINVEVM